MIFSFFALAQAFHSEPGRYGGFMKKYLLCSALLIPFLVTSANAATDVIETGTVGVGFVKQFDDDTDIYQIEGFYRHNLPYSAQFANEWSLNVKLELAAAYFWQSNDSDYQTGRFSIMPQLFLERGIFDLFCGFGTGFMVGDTEYPDHDLGGHFLLNSKVGMALDFTRDFGLEAVYYHQSNAGIYDHNASLNMLSLTLLWHF